MLRTSGGQKVTTLRLNREQKELDEILTEEVVTRWFQGENAILDLPWTLNKHIEPVEIGFPTLIRQGPRQSPRRMKNRNPKLIKACF